MAFAKDGNYPTAAGGGYNTAINAKWDTWLAGPKTSLWISSDGTNFTEYTTTAATTQDTLPTIVLVTFASRPSLDPDNDEIYVELTDPALQSGTELPPADGQVLTWVNANSQWEPADLQGAAIRVALGIGEYADDAAAGTGGVTSGAMYYNTTSSDYRLKT